MYKFIFKRIIDFTTAFTGLILLFPVIIIVFIILLFINKGNPFFYQERPGKNEKVFKIIKFKSMTDKKDSQGKLLPDTERITKFGTIIRKASLDEIPQLLNILKGDMSLIGPRPLLPEYLEYYTNTEKLRHTVRPGITGLAQVNGRNLIDWDKKLQYDVFYVENISFLLDIKILIKTVAKVLASADVSIDLNVIQEPLNIVRKK